MEINLINATMKKFFYLLSVAMMTIGCTKSFEPATESNSQGTVESQTRLTIFTATIGASGRVDLGDKNEAGYPLQWEDGDQITITDGTNQGVYALESVDANGVGSFVFESGAAVATDAEQYTAWCGESASYANGKFTYTVPSTQTYAEGHHLAGKIPLFAQSTTTALSFQTPIAIVRLNLRKEEPVGGGI